MSVVIPALVAVALTVYGAGTLSATVPRWCVLYVIAGLSLCAFMVQVWRGRFKADLLDILAMVFVLYCAESLLWSADWRGGLYSLVNMAAVAVLFMTARRLDAEPLKLAVLVATVILLGDLAVLPWDTGGLGNRNFAAEYMVMALPLCLTARSVLLGRALSWLWPRAVTWFYSTTRKPSSWRWRCSIFGRSGVTGFGPQRAR